MKLLILLAIAFALTDGKFILPKALEKHSALKHPRIVGGEEAEPGSIPFQISFQNSYGHLCGGSILNKTFSLTAAHCCEGESSYDAFVVAGAHNKSGHEPFTQTIKVKRIISHPEYDGSRTIYDVCLLEHETEVKYKSTGTFGDVSPVAMPQNDVFPPGTHAIVSGWGDTEFGGYDSPVLLYTEVDIFSDKECEEAYGSKYIPEHHIGAAAPGKDSCQGDSGGPMVCGQDKVLCGIVSWGYGCASPIYPGIYARVTSYLDWIHG